MSNALTHLDRTSTMASPCGALINALSGDRPDAAIGKAIAQLAAGADLSLFMALVKALVGQGVAGLAIRLMEASPALLDAAPQIARLRNQLRTLPDGSIGWDTLRGQFEINRRAAGMHRSHIRPVLDALPIPGDQFDLFRTRSGNTCVVQASERSKLQFVFAFDDYEYRASQLELPALSASPSFALRGVPDLPLLQRLLRVTDGAGYEAPVDTVETDSLALSIWLHLIDDAEVLGSERLGLFAGADAVQQYRLALHEHMTRNAGELIITNARPGWSPPEIDRSFFDDVRTHHDATKESLVETQYALYEGKTPADWGRRFRDAAAGGPPLRILGFTSRFSTVMQHAMRDLGRSLRRRGCAFELVMQTDACCTDVDTWSPLAGQAFDLIVVINHLRSELGQRVHPAIPFVCWIQDHMHQLLTRDAGASVGPFDLLVGRGRSLLHTQYGYPLDRFIPSSNLTDLETYSHEPVPADDRAKFDCDVSYVGHGSETPEHLADELGVHFAGSLHYDFRALVSELRHALQAQGWVSVVERLAIMLAVERDGHGPPLSPADRAAHVHPQVNRLFDRIVRHEALDWAARWAESRHGVLRIFGRGWDRHPRFAPYACGEVDNGYSLRCVAQASRINLQINAHTSLHQRLLDSIASGGFVLSRFNPIDFARPPYDTIRAFIDEHGITALDALLALKSETPELAEAFETLQRLGMATIDSLSDEVRRREVDLMHACVDHPEHLFTDEALLENLRTLQFVPHRVAGDINGFEATTFDSKASLHDLLDRYVISADDRSALVEQMRASVATRDTYDQLVDQVFAAIGQW